MLIKRALVAKRCGGVGQAIVIRATDVILPGGILSVYRGYPV